MEPDPTPRRRGGRRAQATRERLLAAAEREFGHRGFHATSISAITLRAGVAQGTFYLYFPTKEDCFRVLVEESGRALRQRLRRAMASAPERLEGERRALLAFLAFAREHAGLYRIVAESQFVDERVYRAYYARLAEGYTAGLEAAAARGELRPGQAEVRAWAIMGVGHFLGLRYGLWDTDAEHDTAVIDEAMRLIADGMAPVERPA